MDSISTGSRPTRPKIYPLPAAAFGRGNLSNRFNTAALYALDLFQLCIALRFLQDFRVWSMNELNGFVFIASNGMVHG